jgi:multidrug transporter EmrE-like cation transporter
MRTLFPIAGWLICFTVLNVIVKDISQKVFSGSLVESLVAMTRLPQAYVAAVLYVACALLYFVALSRLPLSTAGPVFMILGVVTTIVLGFTFFGEQVTPIKLLAAGVCLLGTLIFLFGAAD